MSPPYVDIGDGHQVFVRDWGTGQPVVLLAGWAMDSRGWAEVMTRLTRSGVRAIAVDRRGHGRSTDPGRYDYDVLVDDLATVLDALAVEGAVLVGHSGAAGEIIGFLARYGSNRVKAVVLVAATGPRPASDPASGEPVSPDVVDATISTLIGDLPGWIDETLPSFAPEAPPTVHRWLASMALDTSRQALVDFQHAIMTTDLTAHAATIDVPVTLLHGDHDVSAPLNETARRYVDLIPGSCLRVYTGAAHGLVLTHAERLAADIIDVARS